MENVLNIQGHTTVRLKRAKTGLIELVHEEKPNQVGVSFKWMAIRQLFGGTLYGFQTSLELSNLFTADNSAVGGAEANKDGIAVGNDTNLARSGNGSWLSLITTLESSAMGSVATSPLELSDAEVSYRGTIQFDAPFDVYWIILGIDYSGYDGEHGAITEPFDISIAEQAIGIGSSPIEAEANDTLIVDWTINTGI